MPINSVEIDKKNKTVFKRIDRQHPKNIVIAKHFSENYGFKDPLIDHEVSIMEELAPFNISPKILKVSEDGILMTYEGESIKQKPPRWYPKKHGGQLSDKSNTNNDLINVEKQVKYILSVLKKKSIKHNDLNDENILINKNGEIKIIDFTFANTKDVVGPEAQLSEISIENDFIFCAKLTDETLYHAVKPINWEKMKEKLLTELKKAIPQKPGRTGAHVDSGYIYHGLPFQDLPFNSHRPYSNVRARKILSRLPKDCINGVDLGCSVGSLTFELQMRGKKMTGIDYDESSINFAKTLEKYKKYNCHFINEKINMESANKMQNYDFIIWLSNWMWIAKFEGIEIAHKILNKISSKTNHLFFDTAQGGSDSIDSYQLKGRSDVYKLLKKNTDFRFIEDLGLSEESYHQRNLFYCHN
tara:strand:+ start:1707 stop:2948 length:1242 start_codon:yes stop_codon:yes gene_type:complete